MATYSAPVRMNQVRQKLRISYLEEETGYEKLKNIKDKITPLQIIWKLLNGAQSFFSVQKLEMNKLM